jgi:hypothetical protein
MRKISLGKMRGAVRRFFGTVAEIYVNGVFATTVTGYTGGYEEEPINDPTIRYGQTRQ